MSARFNDFRDLSARFDSTGCINGADHKITKGDDIGYMPRTRRRPAQVCCSECWQSWSVENQEADMVEESTHWRG